jgi:NAD(P)-dependent dehydrogenase (short-subunit alcohol dehydrogenase family)
VPTVLLTGCHSGFGLLSGLLFARQGHRVFATMPDLEAAGPLRETASDEGLDLEVLQLDVTDDRSVRAAVAEAIDRSGGLDIVVNTADVELRGPVEDASDEEMRALFDTNVFGLVRVLRAVLPHLRDRGEGVIVNVGSVAGLVARPFGGLYSATKHAVEAVTEALHVEAEPFGIRVAVIEPGQVETDQLDRAVVSERFTADSPYQDASKRFDRAIRGLLPDGTPAQPETVAEVIVAVALDRDARLRNLVGADAELIMSIRSAADFESYEQTIRDALDWSD